MADFALPLAGEIFEFYRLNFLDMSGDARRFYVPRYGYDVTPGKEYAVVLTRSSRGQRLKFPRGLQLRKFDELATMDLCNPGCKVPAVTFFEDPSKRWIPYDKGVIRIDGRHSMTVFKCDGSVEHLINDVPMWGV